MPNGSALVLIRPLVSQLPTSADSEMKCLCLVLLFTVLLGVHAQDDVGLDDLINSLFTNPSGGANDPATAANNNNPVPIQPAAAGDNGASIVRPTNPAPVQPAQPVQPSNQAANKVTKT